MYNFNCLAGRMVVFPLCAIENVQKDYTICRMTVLKQLAHIIRVFVSACHHQLATVNRSSSTTTANNSSGKSIATGQAVASHLFVRCCCCCMEHSRSRLVSMTQQPLEQQQPNYKNNAARSLLLEHIQKQIFYYIPSFTVPVARPCRRAILWFLFLFYSDTLLVHRIMIIIIAKIRWL